MFRLTTCGQLAYVGRLRDANVATWRSDPSVRLVAGFEPHVRAPRHYPVRRREVVQAVRPRRGRCGNPVVTGRKIGLRASGGEGSAKRFFDAGVMTGVVQSAAIT